MNLNCPLPEPLKDTLIFPRAARNRATLVHWRRRDSTAADWAKAVSQRHGWCVELPPGIFLLDDDGHGMIDLLKPRLPAGYGLVQSSPNHFHMWICGTAPSGANIGHIGNNTIEVHGPGRLATLPPSLHVDHGTQYKWLKTFSGNEPITPQSLGITIQSPLTVKPHRSNIGYRYGVTTVSLHDLMDEFTGQEGHRTGNEWSYFCVHHEDRKRSLMVNDEKGVFYCHGVGCGFTGNRITIEKLLGIRQRHGPVKIKNFEVKFE